MLWLQEIFILPQVSKERGSRKPNILNSIVKINWTSEGVRWVGGGGLSNQKAFQLWCGGGMDTLWYNFV